jgi:hypothetical protein
VKVNRCHFCDSKNIFRDRYAGLSFFLMAVLTLGIALIGIPWLPVSVHCRDCDTTYIAS